MKKLAVILFLGTLVTFPSCFIDPNQFAPKDTEIEGLELTFSSLDTVDLGFYEEARSVLFRNESTGFYTSSLGALYKTKDGGKTWVKVRAQNKETLEDLFFVDDNSGWAVGGRPLCGPSNACEPKTGVFIQTKDGGETWQDANVVLSSSTQLQSVWFTTPLNGIVVGASVHDKGTGLMYSTVDGGQTWQERHFANIGGVMNDIQFIDTQNGLISCSSGRVMRTSDGGANWIVEKQFPELDENIISCVKPSIVGPHIIAFAGGQSVSRTIDGGVTWKPWAYPNVKITEMIFITHLDGFVFGEGVSDFLFSFSAIKYTKDGGQTWIGSNEVDEIWPVVAVSFPTPNLGFGVSGTKMVKIKVK